MKRLSLYFITVIAAIGIFIAAMFFAEDKAVKQQEDVFNNHQLLITSITAKAYADQLKAIYDRSLALASSDIPLLFQKEDDPVQQISRKLSSGREAYIGLMGHVLYGPDKSVMVQRVYERMGINEPEAIWNKWIDDSWQQIVSKESGAITPSIIAKQDYQLMGLIMPVRQGGDFLGVLLTVVDLGLLNTRYIQPMRSGDYGAGYMLDDKGTIIYDHETEIIGRSVFDGMHKDYPDLLRFDHRMMNELSGQDTYTFTVHRNGEVKRKLGAWSSVRIADRRFIIALSTPDYELSGGQQNLRLQSIIFAAVLALIVAAISMMFLRLRIKLFEENERQLEKLVADRTRDLALSQERFRDMAEASSDWYWEMDHNLCYTFISDRIKDITGIDPKDFIGKTRETLANTNEDQDTWHRHSVVLNSHLPYRDFRFRVKLKNGETRYFSSSGKPVLDKDGNFLGYRGTGSDVTKEMEAERVLNENYIQLEHMVDEKTRDLKAATEEAKRANAAKSDFLAKMSHELRTPLNAIIGFSEMLMEEGDDIPEEEVNEALMRINRAGEHLLELVNDILDLSKVEAGKLELIYGDLDLEPFLVDLVKTSQLLASRNNSTLDLDVQGDLGIMTTDRIKLKQVLFNLLSNACKFTKDGEIKVTAKREKASPDCGVDAVDKIVFAISDTGIGMTSEQTENLFQEFYQVRTELVPEFSGTGLGLAISRRLVDLMGGNLGIRSVFGEGTVCTVILPVRALSDQEKESHSQGNLMPLPPGQVQGGTGI